MTKIKALLRKHREILLYVVFGALTTLVNYIVYFACKAVGLTYSPSTVVAWVLAVTFAYCTNRIWVFKSKSRGAKRIFKEMGLFVAARLFSLILELGIMFVGMSLLHAGLFVIEGLGREWPVGEFITKTVAQVIIVISNYFFSKLIIFKKKQETNV